MTTCDEFIGMEETNSNNKKDNLQNTNFNILLAFLLITIALLIPFSIYCYLIKYWANKKHLLPFHDTNKELRDFLY